MRGKPKDWIMTAWDARNIPAYAGKTEVGFSNPTDAQEHPRVCGENPLLVGLPGNHSEHPRVCGENRTQTRSSHRPSGTSPRMRGKHAPSVGRNLRGRNIPAYAGKTDIMIVSAVQDAEHPRVCGENAANHHSATGRDGTSPRMRGKRRGAIFSRVT